MKLLLTSSGIIDSPLEKDFLELIDNRDHLKVALLPNASDSITWELEEGSDTNYVARLVGENKVEESNEYRYFTKYGHDVVIADLRDDPNAVQEKLQHADVIAVPGGDPNYLIDLAKKAGLNEYLASLLERGVVYVGTSAGSQMVLPDFGITWWKSDTDGDHTGLAIVDFVLVPHCNDQEKSKDSILQRKKYLQSKMHFPWKVFLLRDGQAIKVEGDVATHIGEGKKVVV